jgi:protein-S-isoprenylcysteine O-methyltransferase Ste14
MKPTSQQTRDAATAGVITPLSRPPDPGPCVEHLLPLRLSLPGAALVQWTVGGSLILIGAGIAAAVVRNFSRAATPVPTNQPVRALVTTGTHAWSRKSNLRWPVPSHAGIGLAARSPWILILTLPLAITLRYSVVAREEKYRKRRFGKAYRDYKARVRRWL